VTVPRAARAVEAAAARGVRAPRRGRAVTAPV
jgi:hypothetical protein